MSPKQKALIAALLEKAAAEKLARNTKVVTKGASDGVTQERPLRVTSGVTPVSGDSRTSGKNIGGGSPLVAKARAETADRLVATVAVEAKKPAAKVRSGARHKLGQAA